MKGIVMQDFFKIFFKQGILISLINFDRMFEKGKVGLVHVNAPLTFNIKGEVLCSTNHKAS